MLLLLAALFIGLPVLEIYLLIEVGGHLGPMATLGLCVLTGVVGAWLARSQGGQALKRAQERLNRGEVPASEALDGVMIVIAGFVLMTPGFVTDAVGILLLLPPSRAIARRFALDWLRQRLVAQNKARDSFFAQFGGQGPFGDGQGPFGRGQGPFGGPGRPADRHSTDAQSQPDVEFLPPDKAPRPPARKGPPKVIDVD